MGAWAHNPQAWLTVAAVGRLRCWQSRSLQANKRTESFLCWAVKHAPMTSALTVCVVLEPGFCDLVHGVASDAQVSNDGQLKGYDVDVRKVVMQGMNYSVQAYNSYGEVNVRTRAGDCDVGWANYFITASRQSCAPSAQTGSACLPLDASTAAGTVSSWEPYRCCVDFGMNVWQADIVALQFQNESNTFFDAFFSMVRN
eukprot:SAG31_NODE_5141_length_2718_cov_2.346315_2_plen_199_part_00